MSDKANYQAFRVYDSEAGEYLTDNRQREWVLDQEGELLTLDRLGVFGGDFERGLADNRYQSEPFSHRHDTAGAPIHAGDIVLVQESRTAEVYFSDSALAWMLKFTDTEGCKMLVHFESDENGVMADLQIIGNIHQEKKES